jgi:DNA-binding NtrC family response regulator
MTARPFALPRPAAGVHPERGRASQPPSTGRILVIGDLRGVIEGGELQNLRVEPVDWGQFAPAALDDQGFELIVPVVSSFEDRSAAFFQLLSNRGARSPVLAVLPADQFHSDQFRLAVSAVDDFVVLPVRFEEWRQRVTRLTGPAECGPTCVADKLAGEMGLQHLIGRSAAFVDVVHKVPLVARSGSPALITGETGTGKELCARAIHFMSVRRNQPFIPVDCGALPDSLFENELFGHVRGAFTDAHRDQRGLVGLADGGTLFLDEVDSLTVPAQAKLLRFLQERSFRPLGSDRFLHANVNVLSAMNRDPERLVRDKLFRADLFFRLNVVRLHIAPLRERPSDIPLLARHFVASFAAETGVRPRTLSPAAMSKLLSYDWPGNVRELNNVLQRAVVLADERQIRPEHVLLADTLAPSNDAEIAPSGSALSFRAGRALVIDEFERSYVARLLEKHGGNVTRAAREAQKDRRAFGRLLKKHAIRAGSKTA